MNNPDFFYTTVKMFSSLLIVLGFLVTILYVFKKFLRKDGAGSGNNLVKILSNTYVGVKKSISLVEIPGAILVLGITGDNMTLLCKIDDQKTVDEIKMATSARQLPSFSDTLKRISEKMDIVKKKS